MNVGSRVEVIEPHYRDARLAKGTRGTVIAIGEGGHILLLRVGRKKMFAFTEWLRVIGKHAKNKN
jgi:hypothetical protein